MTIYDNWLTEGTEGHTGDDVIWLRRSAVLEAFQWGGKCMRIDGGSENLGDVTVTQRQSIYGGFEQDSMIVGGAAEATTTLVMKAIQADRKKTDLRTCLWDVDQRKDCGSTRDNPFSWVEIKRYVAAKMTSRDTPASSFSGDDNNPQEVSFAMTSFRVADIYRVAGTEVVEGIGGDDEILDAFCSQPARCPSGCDQQSEPIFLAVTEDDAANCYLLYNLHGGDLTQWVSVTLTDFGANDANAVCGVGEFVFVVSTADASAIYSDDLGTTQVNVTHADWAAHAPNAVDCRDLSRILICGADGYIWVSRDRGRTISQLDAGGATTSDLTDIQIAHDNPQVAYAVSNAADVIVKTMNGGRTWSAVTATGTGGTGAFSLCVIDQFKVLVGTDAGELFETTDGGVTWTEQADLPDMTVKANVTIHGITYDHTGRVAYLCMEETGAVNHIYRNVDGGASGMWYIPTDLEALTGDPMDIVCSGPNLAVAVGGETGVSEAVVLIN